MRDPAMIGAKTEQRWVLVRDVQTDADYERPLNMQRVKRIAAEFDPDAIGSIMVSQRDSGVLVILDGQHRLAALKHMGWDDQTVPALVYLGLSKQDEARVFRVINERRSKPRPFDLYRARLVEGDAEAVAVDSVLRRVGLQMAEAPGLQNIAAVSTVMQVYRMADPATLQTTLDVLKEAWGHLPEAYNGETLMAVALVVRRYRKHGLDVARLKKMLQTRMPMSLIAQAKAMGTMRAETTVRTAVLPALIVQLYNERLRNKKLPPWEDRGSKAIWRED